MTNDLKDLTLRLGLGYRAWKDGEKVKNTAKDDFFEAVEEMFREQNLAEKFVTVHAESEADAREILAKQNPDWVVGRVLSLEDGRYEGLIIENAAYQPFSFVNPDDGMVYSKQVVAGQVFVDDERLKSEDPDLYEQVTYVPEPERVLKDLDDLPAHVLAKLSEYIYQGRPTVKLAAPRRATDEELESA